ncbi:MAG: hypothetical protein ACYCYO_18180 [Bacilli bacterium]
MKAWTVVICSLLIVASGVGVNIWTESQANAQFANHGLQEVASGLRMALSGMRYSHYGLGNGTFALDADGTAKYGIGHATGAWNTIEPALVKCGLPYSEAFNIEQILEHLEMYSPPSPNLSIPVSTRNRIYNWTNQFLLDLYNKNEGLIQSIKQNAPKLIQMYKGYQNDPLLQTLLSP